MAMLALAGLGAPAGISLGNHTINVTGDPRLGTVTRRFLVTNVPSASSPPLLLGFHGQSNSPESWGPASVFTSLAKQHGWLMALPAGIREYRTPQGSGTDSTWNVGTQDDDSTCLEETTSTQCLSSCAQLGRCRGRCNWSTCHDDLAFIDQLIKTLTVVDADRIFMVGESNGAMFVHYLLSEFPGRFVAAAPVFGQPLLGYMVGSQYQLLLQKSRAARTSILQLHDRSDTIIPWQAVV